MTEGDVRRGAPRIAVIAGTPQLVRSARALGVHTVLVHDAGGPVPGCADDADEVLAVDLADTDALHTALARLHAGHPLQRVLSLTESGLLPAAAAAERLGLPGNALRTVRLLQDKREMRALLNARGLSPVRTAAPRDAAELAGFCGATGGPVILKPAAGSGSEAVFRVGTPADAEDAWARFTEAGGTGPVAEEYLDGPEISVETFTHDGTHTVVTMTDKDVWPSFVEAGHTVPSRLPADVREETAVLVRAFLGAVGLREGPAHTEVKITSGGPRIIESHNRIGGDKIRELVRRAHGIDLPALTVGCPLGLLPPPPAAPVASAGAAIRFLAPAPGTVRRISVPEPERADDIVSLDVAVGDRVGPVRSSDDRAGHVLVTGTDAADAARRGAALRDRVLIETGD